MSAPVSTLEKLAIHGGPQLVALPPDEQWIKVNEEAKQAVMALLDEGITSIPGNDGIIGEFEDSFAEMVGTKYALTMTNGTAALHSAYFAIGVGPGDEVIVPTYTWHATITPILHCAATPVFCDIDPATLCIDPADIERKITPRTKAISIVHVFGNVCDMDRILAIAQEYGLDIIEDCSHAHGASWKGRQVGSFGAVNCFSMQGAKAVSGGEAGVVTTDSGDLMDRMILLGHFGRTKTGTNPAIAEVGDMSLGTKYRAHPLAIALAYTDLKRLPELNERRTANYEFLNERLRGCPGIEIIDALPGAERGGYLEFKFKLSKDVLQIADRQRIVEAMAAEGAPVTADRYSDFNYTYGLLHAAPLFNSFDLHQLGGCFYDPTREGEAGANAQVTPLPVAEDLAQRLITLPAFTDVGRESMEQVSDAMIKVMTQVESL